MGKFSLIFPEMLRCAWFSFWPHICTVLWAREETFSEMLAWSGAFKKNNSWNQAKVQNEHHSLMKMQDIRSNRRTQATGTPSARKPVRKEVENSFSTFDLLESPKLANAMWKADDAGKELRRADALRRGSSLTSMVCEGWNFRSRL